MTLSKSGALPTVVGRAVSDAGVVLHAGGSVGSRGAYVFLSESGGGKSTLTALCDGLGVPVLGDDGVLVLEKEAGFYLRPLPRQAAGLPATVAISGRTLLRRVFFLAKAPNPRLESVSPLEAVARCLKQHLVLGFPDADPPERLQLLDRLVRLFRTVPAHVLHFSKDGRFWDVIGALEEREEKKPEPALV